MGFSALEYSNDNCSGHINISHPLFEPAQQNISGCPYKWLKFNIITFVVTFIIFFHDFVIRVLFGEQPFVNASAPGMCAHYNSEQMSRFQCMSFVPFFRMRQQKLEQEHADVEFKIRKLLNKPGYLPFHYNINSGAGHGCTNFILTFFHH